MSLFHPFPVSPLARLSHLALPLAALLLAGVVTPLAARDSLSVAAPALASAGPVLASAGTLVSLTDPVSGRSIQVRLADHRMAAPPAGRAQAAGNAQVAPSHAHPSASCPVTRSCGLRAPAPLMEP